MAARQPWSRPAARYTYVAATPVVTGVSPSSGPLAGGTSVAITGTGLTGATAVDFGSVAVSSFTVNSDTSITATAPEGSTAGTVDVTVTTPSGTSATSSADQYTYTAADLAVGLTATADPLLSGGIDYSQTVTNDGPDTATSATITITLSTKIASVSGLPANCSYDSTAKTVTCTLTNLANGGEDTNAFGAQVGLLALGDVTSTATETSSSPTDPNSSNNTASATCDALTGLIISC